LQRREPGDCARRLAACSAGTSVPGRCSSGSATGRSCTASPRSSVRPDPSSATGFCRPPRSVPTTSASGRFSGSTTRSG
jgi:hypothetical protein